MRLVDRARPRVDVATLLCEEAVEQLTVSGASLVVITPEGSRAVVGAAGSLSDRLEEIQLVTGEGPSVDAFEGGTLVLAADLLSRPAWPVFSPSALDAGIAAVFALPVQIGGIRLGVLELLRTDPWALSETDLTQALHFQDAAALVLMHGEDLDPWTTPGTTRRMFGVEAVVHQATGMVSVQAAVALGEALLLLRGRAFADGRPLAEVARDVTSRVLRFGPPGRDGAGPG